MKTMKVLRCFETITLILLCSLVFTPKLHAQIPSVKGKCEPTPPCYCNEECFRCGPGGCPTPGESPEDKEKRQKEFREKLRQKIDEALRSKEEFEKKKQEDARNRLKDGLEKKEKQDDARNRLKDGLEKKEKQDEARNRLKDGLEKKEKQDEARNRLKKELQKYKWSGNWKLEEQELVHNTLRRLKDKTIRDWITVNVLFEFNDDPGQQKISPWAGNATLVFTKDFFSRVKTNAGRDNLIAFEAGKAFWNNKMAGNQTVVTWFSNYSVDHSSLISNLKNAELQKDLSFIKDPPGEVPSAFGYVFGAQALGLQLDETAQNEFKVRIAPLLQGKQ
jgi:hypothetical protein